MSDKYCLAPWRALAIDPDGAIFPDIQYQNAIGNIISEDVLEVFRNGTFSKIRSQFKNGTFPEECSNCEKKENGVGHSRRLFFFDKLNPTQNNSDEILLEYLDLNLSNYCNLKCRMCNSVSSSSWIKEDQYLRANYKDFHRPDFKKPRKLNESDVDKILKNRELFEQLKFLSLRGGEPLLEANNIKVLKKLVEWRLAEKIVIDLSTNGTHINSELIDLLSEFKEIQFHLSLEASGPLYSYIRGGTSFSIGELEKNIPYFREIPKLKLIFTLTMSIYNILALNETLEWFSRHKEPRDEIVMSNIVVRPEYLNYQILPNNIKKIAIERLKSSRIIEMHYNEPIERLIPDSGFDKIKESLRNSPYSENVAQKLRKQFVSYNKALDELRKTTLIDLIPEFSSFYFQEDS